MGQVCGRVVVVVMAVGMSLMAGCGGSTSPAATPVSSSPYAASATSSLGFTATEGFAAATQTATLTNTGTAALTISGVAVGGTSSSDFSMSNGCGATLAVGASCTVTVGFTANPTGTYAGTLSFTDTAANSPQVTALTGTAIASAVAGATDDCSVGTGLCAYTFGSTFQLATDPIQTSGGFHGYADPSMRKDPNSTMDYYAYSWAHVLGDGTHVVDLHLASSSNNGQSFTYVGPMYQSVQTTQTASTAYSSVNDSSTETVDLIPIPQAGGQTLWVQAHQSYLVKPQGGIYDQLNATNLISVSAVLLTSPTAASAGMTLLGWGTAPEARLGAGGTDPSRTITQSLSTFNATTAKCTNWGQPALWYQAPTLYLGLECTETTGSLDANELAHFLFATTPTGTDASKWVWTLAAEFATPAQAGKLGSTTAENTSYSFFTEPEFVALKSGQLALILTPGVFNVSPTATQPVIQYGCRVVPVTSLSTTGITLDTDATTGAPVVLAKVTENDLYTGVNEGPAACTYEPTAVNGVIMGRKFENDPTYGFYIYPTNSGISP